MAAPRRLDIAMIATPWFELPPAAYGGIESMCATLVDGLVDQGHQVTVIGVGTNGTKGRFIAVDDTPHGPERLGRAGPEVVFAARAARVLRTLHPDVVHDHSTAGPLQAAHRRAPTVVTAHGTVSGELGDYYRALGDTVHMVAISRAQQRQAPDITWSGHVYNALRTREYPFRAHKGDHAVFLGRIARDKGVHLAIEAARRAGVRLVIAGRCNDPGEQPYMDREIKPRLGQDVRWIGEVDHCRKVELLAGARCLLFPICWDEPFGMVQIEAMACGTPVVALRRGSVPEIIEDRVTGYICDDPAELADAVRAVGRLSPQACRRRVADHFDATHMTCGYEELYARLAASAGQAAASARGRPGSRR